MAQEHTKATSLGEDDGVDLDINLDFLAAGLSPDEAEAATSFAQGNAGVPLPNGGQLSPLFGLTSAEIDETGILSGDPPVGFPTGDGGSARRNERGKHSHNAPRRR